MSKSVQPMFSSKSFIVSDLTSRSLIHFEFIFVYAIRECFNFILLHVAVQFSQHNLLKRLYFLHCTFLSPLSQIRSSQKDGLISGLSILFHWSTFLFCAIPPCLDYCSFVEQSKVREPDFSNSVLLSQDCFVFCVSIQIVIFVLVL